MRLTIRVTPGARRPGVGGPAGPVGSDGPALAVRVAARAVDGAATEAALAAVAQALGVRRRQVTLVRGATARTKVVEVEGDEVALADRLTSLLAAG
ncbi:MAG TPA: DUF167 family protein [Iamia sp.]|nr:DUF167 family protein [Iamia sp.]